MFGKYLEAFTEVIEKTVYTDNSGQEKQIDEGFEAVIAFLKENKDTNARIYLIGNGGSSGIVSHGAIDFLNACGFKAHALTDNSLLTCMANDYGYENVFKQPFATLLNPEDIVISISSSGTSKNIVSASEAAKSKGCKVITFSGFSDDNGLRKTGDFNFWLDSNHYGRVEIGHSLLLHYITDRLVIK